MVAITFNANDVDPSTGGGDVFETGEYGFQIVGSSVKATKKQDGHMLVLEASCIDEGMAGKRLTIRLNIDNPNATAKEIAFRDLSAICHVTGQLQITDTQQLHGKPFRVRLEKLPRNDDPTKFNNEVRAYMDINGNPPGQGGNAGAPAAGGAPSAPSAPTNAGPAPTSPAAPAAGTPTAPNPAPATNPPMGQTAAPAPAGTEPPFGAPAAGDPAAASPTAPAPATGANPPWMQG